jgi:hypothetical protein
MEHASYICTDLPNCVMGCFELGSHKNGTWNPCMAHGFVLLWHFLSCC